MKSMLLLVALVLSGCGTTYQQQTSYVQPKATESEVQEANLRSLQCLARYAKQLDDKVSDVKVISSAVAQSCRKERGEFFLISTRGWGALDNNRVMSTLVEKDTDAATYYILTQRSKKE
jgi:hypothetical protein